MKIKKPLSFVCCFTFGIETEINFISNFVVRFIKKKIRNGTLGTLILGWYNTCVIYLHVIEACLKFTTVMFYFCHSKNISNITKNIFSSMSICCWKKLLVNKYKKQMCYKENLFFFWRHEKWRNFFFKSFSFSIQS